MKITIEDDAMYFYLKHINIDGIVSECLTDVRGLMLYDASDNLIGLKLLNTRDNADISLNGVALTETIKLPAVGYIDTPIHNAAIAEHENELTIWFDKVCESAVHRMLEEDCIIDFYKEGIVGIEIIASHPIGNLDVIKPFIV